MHYPNSELLCIFAFSPNIRSPRRRLVTLFLGLSISVRAAATNAGLLEVVMRPTPDMCGPMPRWCLNGCVVLDSFTIVKLYSP